MPAPLDPANVDNAVQMYLAGEPWEKIHATTRVSSTEFSRIRNRRGIPPRRNLDVPTYVLDAYVSGSSELELSEQFGISRGAIRRRLLDAGVTIRGCSDAGKNRAGKMTAEQRAAQTAAANVASRGSKASMESLCRRASKIEDLGKFGSDGEAMVAQVLADNGYRAIPQKAVGKYNVDLAVPRYAVAVEILGGGWHALKNHSTRHAYILNSGWHLVYIWNYEGASALGEGAADYLVAFLDEVRGDPSSVSKYRVIAGGGKLLAAGSANDGEFTLVPPPRGRQ